MLFTKTWNYASYMVNSLFTKVELSWSNLDSKVKSALAVVHFFFSSESFVFYVVGFEGFRGIFNSAFRIK